MWNDQASGIPMWARIFPPPVDRGLCPGDDSSLR